MNKHCWSCRYFKTIDKSFICEISNKLINSKTKACKKHKLDSNLKGIKGSF